MRSMLALIAISCALVCKLEVIDVAQVYAWGCVHAHSTDHYDLFADVSMTI